MIPRETKAESKLLAEIRLKKEILKFCILYPHDIATLRHALTLNKNKIHQKYSRFSARGKESVHTSHVLLVYNIKITS